MRKMYQVLVGMLLLTLVCSASACRVLANQATEEVPGKEKTKKNYYVASFTAIELTGVADVSFTQSDKVSVEVIGPENYLPFVVIESRDGVLKVNTRKIGNKRVGKGLEVKIAAPVLQRLSNRGVGDFKTTNPLKTDRLWVDNLGVGDTRLTGLECDSLTVNHRGVGDLRLSGTAIKAAYTARGVGDVDAREMKAEDVSLEHTGVGDISCHASKTIRIISKGVGDVSYYGNPQVLGMSKKGVGSLESK